MSMFCSLTDQTITLRLKNRCVPLAGVLIKVSPTTGQPPSGRLYASSRRVRSQKSSVYTSQLQSKLSTTCWTGIPETVSKKSIASCLKHAITEQLFTVHYALDSFAESTIRVPCPMVQEAPFGLPMRSGMKTAQFGSFSPHKWSNELQSSFRDLQRLLLIWAARRHSSPWPGCLLIRTSALQSLVSLELNSSMRTLRL